MKWNKFLLVIVLLACAITKGDETMPDRTNPQNRPSNQTKPVAPAWWQGSQYANQYDNRPIVANPNSRNQNNAQMRRVGNQGNVPTGQVIFPDDTTTALQQQQDYEKLKRRQDEVQGVNSFTSNNGTVARTPQGTAAPTYFNPNQAYGPALAQNPDGTPKANFPKLPAWFNGNLSKTTVSRNKPNAGTPTGTFLAQGGDVAQGPTGTPTPTWAPTGTFQSGGGNWVQGPNGLAYYVGTPGPNTFIAAGGDAVRGPDFGYTIPTDQGGGGDGGYGGFGTRYGWGRGKSYGGGGYNNGYIPNWLMNLYSWNYKG